MRPGAPSGAEAALPPVKDPPKGRPRYDYTRGPIGRGIVRLAVPSCAEQVSWNIDALAEVFWVGRLGPEYLAAISLSFMTVFFLRAVGLGLRIAGAALVAQRVGAGDAEGASLATAQVIILAAAYYLLITALGFLTAPWILALLTTDPRVLRLGTAYLRTAFVFFAFLDGIFTLAHQFRAAGEPRFSLSAMMTSTVVSMTAMPLLIFGAGPVPALGLPGAAAGIGLGRLAGMALMLTFLFSGRSRLHLRPRHFRPRPELMGAILRLGWPAAAQNLLERSANLILLRMLSSFGPVVLAAWSIAQRVSTVSRMPGFGIQAAVRTMVGQNVGAGEYARARRSVVLALWGLAAVMGTVTLLLFLNAGSVVTFFGLRGEAVGVGVLGVRILSLGLLFETIRRMLAGAFQGAANTKPPMVVEGVVRWGFQVPAAYLAAFPLGFAGAGVWAAMTGGHALGGTALLVWFFLWSRARGLGSHALAARPGRAGGGGPPGGGV